ncbi:MAG: ribosome recycling factor [Candidatus Cloacimonetes bacterium]|jgi:ribosome recycling factor|nr:ribosome recycling factor [Candidatus Cloacimonadota bacterium]MBT4333537.1 ribosome recycling factor [Candidatus Cloacimonadota bacterium]MBT4576452.1 ribosome recycling factor [Candidatus Cloacimonadota bacterium]MBT5420977.1 ribosome recycling factor [Candidatus Cloacimonadota bacterium]
MQELLQSLTEKMKDAFESMLKHYSRIRTGRANASALDDIKIDYYGAPTPIKQLCNISIPEPRLIVIQPWDKSILESIEKTLLSSNIGVTPDNDGNVIRLPFQPLTEETRLDIVKQIKKMAEDGKIEIRNIRREGNETSKNMEKKSEISEDNMKDLQIDIQELTDKWVSKVTEAAKTKETEIMEV